MLCSIPLGAEPAATPFAYPLPPCPALQTGPDGTAWLGPLEGVRAVWAHLDADDGAPGSAPGTPGPVRRWRVAEASWEDAQLPAQVGRTAELVVRALGLRACCTWRVCHRSRAEGEGQGQRRRWYTSVPPHQHVRTHTHNAPQLAVPAGTNVSIPFRPWRSAAGAAPLARLLRLAPPAPHRAPAVADDVSAQHLSFEPPPAGAAAGAPPAPAGGTGALVLRALPKGRYRLIAADLVVAAAEQASFAAGADGMPAGTDWGACCVEVEALDPAPPAAAAAAAAPGAPGAPPPLLRPPPSASGLGPGAGGGELVAPSEAAPLRVARAAVGAGGVEVALSGGAARLAEARVALVLTRWAVRRAPPRGAARRARRGTEPLPLLDGCQALCVPGRVGGTYTLVAFKAARANPGPDCPPPQVCPGRHLRRALLAHHAPRRRPDCAAMRRRVAQRVQRRRARRLCRALRAAAPPVGGGRRAAAGQPAAAAQPAGQPQGVCGLALV